MRLTLSALHLVDSGLRRGTETYSEEMMGRSSFRR